MLPGSWVCVCVWSNRKREEERVRRVERGKREEREIVLGCCKERTTRRKKIEERK